MSAVAEDDDLASIQEEFERMEKQFDEQRLKLSTILDTASARVPSKEIWSQPAITTESPNALRTLVDTTNECVSSLKILERPVEQWDDILVYLLTQKLDQDSRRQWELSLESDDPPKFESFMHFLEQRARALVNLETSKSKPSTTNKPTAKSSTSSHVSRNSPSCPVCKEEHLLFRCSKYISLSVESRVKVLQNNNLCFNCLRKGHSSTQCTNEKRCAKCQRNHHTTIHYEKKQENPQFSLSDPVSKSESTTTQPAPSNRVDALNSTSTTDFKTTGVLLATAIIHVRDEFGSMQSCRALIDPGSQSSFITERCTQRLNQPRESSSISVSGIGGLQAGSSKGAVILQIRSVVKPEFQLSLNALILKTITGSTPPTTLNGHTWHHLRGFQLADPEFFISSPIDILIGADVYPELLLNGKRTGPKGSPVAVNTTLGWIIIGPTGNSTECQHTSSFVIQDTLDAKLERFWELEEPKGKSTFTLEE
ncbi:unnamed protein product, partial [Allacma fusca]